MSTGGTAAKAGQTGKADARRKPQTAAGAKSTAAEASKGKKAKDKPGRPALYETAEELQIAIDAYLKKCEPKYLQIEVDGKLVIATDAKGNPVITEHPPTVAGLAYELGFVSRQSLWDMEQRGELFSYAIKRAKLFIEAYHEAHLSTRDKPTGDIFWLKNYGWIDKQELELSGPISIGLPPKPEDPKGAPDA